MNKEGIPSPTPPGEEEGREDGRKPTNESEGHLVKERSKRGGGTTCIQKNTPKQPKVRKEGEREEGK